MIKLELTAILYSYKNIELLSRLNRCCYKMCMNLVGCLNFIDLTIKTHQIKPQMVIFDLTTIEFNSSHLNIILQNNEYKNTRVVFVGYERQRSMVENWGVGSFAFTTIENVEGYIANCLNIISTDSFQTKNDQTQNDKLSDAVTDLLFSLGFSPKHTGYGYLKDIIKQAVCSGGVVSSLVGEQYPFIAVKFKTTVCNIERNIRNAISLAFEHGSKELWENMFYNCYNMSHDKRPTNREFICFCVDKLIGEMDKLKYAQV